MAQCGIAPALQFHEGSPENGRRGTASNALVGTDYTPVHCRRLDAVCCIRRSSLHRALWPHALRLRWRQGADSCLRLLTAERLEPSYSERAQSVQPTGCQLKERCELRSCLELGNRIELLERARESIGEAPRRSRSELLLLRIEVPAMHDSGQVLGHFQL